MHPSVYSSIINNSQIMERAQLFINWWMYRDDVMYIYNRTLLSHEKDEILPFATTWMKLESIMLSEISQRRTNIWFHSYVELKNNSKANEERGEKARQTEKQTLNYREQTNGYQKRGGQGDGLNSWWGLRRALVMMSPACLWKCWITVLYTWN